MKQFEEFWQEYQNDITSTLLVVCAILVIGIITYKRLNFEYEMDITRVPVEQLVDTLNQDAHMTYDTCYTYKVQNYRVDILCNESISYRKLIFRTDYEGIPETFVVNISPASDYKQFEADIISRFIDVHEYERTNCYEFYTDAKGRKSCRIVYPFTDEFNVYIAYQRQPDGKTKKPFLRRKGTDFGYKIDNTNTKTLDIWE